jgi:hypothetical protein
MQTPPPSNPEAPLEFARTEFFHIMKQQFYVRMLGISIMGVVTPIFLSLLFSMGLASKLVRLLSETLTLLFLSS